MHELTITQSILEVALRHAQQAGAARVTHLYLVIGDFSSIIDDSVQFYWDFVSEESMAAGATLHFRRIPGRLRCIDCGHEYPPGPDLGCPQCGGTNVRIASGEEFYLEAIDVEDVAQPTALPTSTGAPA